MLWREPTFFWLLAVVGVLAALVALRLRQRAGMLRAFAEPALVRRLAPDVDPRRRWFRLGLRVVALTLLVIALAGPKWGFQWEEVEREGIDLIVAIDTSRSMLATDVKPNRLERAKLAVLDLIQKLHGDRVGLVAFAGTAFLQCPLTLDYAAFAGSLEAINVGLIPRGGTALGRAIETSLDAFEARQGRYEVMILITDGEDNTGDFEAASKRAAELGVKIYTVGIGTAEGELIPAGKDGAQGFVKDRSGQVVKSRLNEDALRQIALATSGAYVRGVGASLGLDEVFRDHISKIEKREVASTLERRYEDRFQIFLAAALLLLLGEAFIGERKRDRTTSRRWLRLPSLGRRGGQTTALSPGRAGERPAGVTTAVRTGMVLVFLYPVLVGWFDPPGDRAAEGNTLYSEGKYSEAAERYGEGLVDSPASPLLQFNLGDAQYKLGKYTEAMNAFTKTATEGTAPWTARAAYNLGNSYYRLGANAEASDPKAAIASYEQALVAYKRSMGADPHDPDAKFNHEFVTQKLADLRKKLEEQQKEEEQKQQEQQEQQDEQQQDQEQQQDEQQQQEQPQDQPQEQQDQQEQQEAQDQKQQGDQQQQQQEQAQQPEPKPDEQGQQQAADEPGEPEQQAGQPQAAGAEGEGEPDPNHQAAQAVLDTARSEELGPDDMQRQVPVAGVAEPAQDW